jgi:hypothetical protein
MAENTRLAMNREKIQHHLGGFKKAGGTLEIINCDQNYEHRKKAKEIIKNLKASSLKLPEGHSGFYFARKAVEKMHDTHNGVIVVAWRAGEVLGCLCALEEPENIQDGIRLVNMGSIESGLGVGTSMVALAAMIAEKKGYSIYGEPIPMAYPFWKELGWDINPKSLDIHGWNKKDTEIVAAEFKKANIVTMKFDKNLEID